jgi:tetratricopeptide (TPR) repeat protein
LLARALLAGRQPDKATELLEPMVAEFAALAPDPAYVALEAQLGRAYFLRDEFRRSIEVIDRVLQAAEHADLVEVIADALVTRGSALTSVGQLREGLGVIEIGERLARTFGLTTTLLRAINNRISTLGDFDLAATIEAAREGVAVARRVGDRSAVVNLLFLQAWGHMVSGQPDETLATCDAGLAEEPEPADALVAMELVTMVRAARGEPVADILADIERLGSGMTDSNVSWVLHDAPAWIALCEGRFAEAARRWGDGAGAIPQLAPEWRYWAAEAMLSSGDAAGATAELAALDATGFHSPMAELHRRAVRAGLAALEGQGAAALRAYRDVLEELLVLGRAWDHAILTVQMAAMIGPSEPGLVAATATGRAALERMGLKLFLERLDAALALPTEARSGAARIEAATGLIGTTPDAGPISGPGSSGSEDRPGDG